jgi:hypothetical protein
MVKIKENDKVRVRYGTPFAGHVGVVKKVIRHPTKGVVLYYVKLDGQKDITKYRYKELVKI